MATQLATELNMPAGDWLAMDGYKKVRRRRRSIGDLAATSVTTSPGKHYPFGTTPWQNSRYLWSPGTGCPAGKETASY